MGIFSKKTDSEKVENMGETVEKDTKKVTNAASILEGKVIDIAEIDAEIAECEGHEVWKETQANLKALKKSRKQLEAEVAMTINENIHLFEGNGEVSVNGYRVRSKVTSKAVLSDEADVQTLIEKYPTVLKVELINSGVKQAMKMPNVGAELELLGVLFKEIESIEVKAL